MVGERGWPGKRRGRKADLTWVVLVSVVVGVYGYSHNPVQYHIQTDKGPDRYFRFQTYNGQYRKEKRLDDGTVLGTYGWVDAVGVLRLYDYIADAQGYRIVRRRTMKVAIPTPPPPTTTTTTTRAPPTRPPVGIQRVTFVQPSPATRPHTTSSAQVGGASTSQNRGTSSWGDRRRRPAKRPQLLRPHTQAQVANTVVREESETKVEAAAGIGPGDLPAEGTFSINYDLGNQFHFEKILSDGTRVGKHGYVDPLGILRVSHYTAGAAGHTQRQESRWVGSRAPAAH
ncbi:hypothetical protein Pcinc_034464 [Petrolisthes cinctipes]|uniref:Cuticle protein 6 n=1 Tax=Petrolisthes cinctipes TaxID=88211 RepID=A0AAE1JZ46_PETCI|nr:hypothetical protein Pcinc_034464 [Petrolisthes cinctipes]